MKSKFLIMGTMKFLSMTKKHHIKLVHEGNYAAEVDVEILDTGNGWSPYLSLEDTQKLEEISKWLI